MAGPSLWGMAKGYWIARVDVDDEATDARYVETNAVAFAK